jgi:hypothetical protein
MKKFSVLMHEKGIFPSANASCLLSGNPPAALAPLPSAFL